MPDKYLRVGQVRERVREHVAGSHSAACQHVHARVRVCAPLPACEREFLHVACMCLSYFVPMFTH